VTPQTPAGASLSDSVSGYLSQIGRKGGSTTGPTKRRGDAEHYKTLAAKAVAARLAKKLKTETKN